MDPNALITAHLRDFVGGRIALGQALGQALSRVLDYLARR